MNERISCLTKGFLVILMSLAIGLVFDGASSMALADDLSSIVNKAEAVKAVDSVDSSSSGDAFANKKTIDFLASGNVNAPSTKHDSVPDKSNPDECMLHIKSDLSKSGDEGAFAYAGNGYSYSIGCNVDDPKSKVGDKYYVIDMIVYGPNTRVAKAWREQFSTNNLAARYLSLDRSISFRWLGANSIVCSITKYNSQLNKFTKICQKTIYVNVTEKSPPLNSYQAPFSSLRFQKDSSSNNLLRLLYSSTTGYKNTNKINRSFLGSRQDNQLKQRQISAEDQLLKTEFTTPTPKMTTTMDAIMREKSKNEWFNKFKETKYAAKSQASLNARAMQFKGSAENTNSKIIEQGSASNESVSKLLKSTERFDPRASRAQMLQPLPVIFIFIVVFSVSIATIIYLTYHQSKEDSSKIPVMSHDPDESIDRINSSRKNKSSTTSAKQTDDDHVSQSCSSAFSSPTVEPASASLSNSNDSASQNSSSCLSSDSPNECTKLKMDDFEIEDVDHDEDHIDYERKRKYLSKQI